MDDAIEAMEPPAGFRHVYGVELLYVEKPAIPKASLLRALRTRYPSAVPLDGNIGDGLLAFAYPDHMIEYTDREAPAQAVVTLGGPVPRGEAIEAALLQTWDFPEAREVVAACAASVLVTDLMASALPPPVRLELFSRMLLAVLEVAPADAIHWEPAQRIVDPEAYAAASGESEVEPFLAGALNVRSFNVAGSDEDQVIDTLGLAALGLPDLQCHFRQLDPDRVGTQLQNLAWYLFENGDVIADGNTVTGIEPGSQWRCQHENALVGPERPVLDVDPGDPYAAGARNRT